MRNGGWLGTIRPPQSSGGIITPNKLWPGQGSSTVVVPTPVAWWKMNEGSGTTLIDTIAANNMSFTASIGAWGTVTGFPGSVFTFNGTQASGTGAVATSAVATNFTTGPFSVSAWVETSTVATQQTIVSNAQNPSGNAGWILEIFQSKVTVLLGNNLATPSYILVQGNTTLSSGVVYNLAMTYNGSGLAAGITLYVNGVAQTNTVIQDSLGSNSYASNAAPQIGWSLAYPTVPFTGTLADIRVWNSPLSSAQMSLVFSGGIA